LREFIVGHGDGIGMRDLNRENVSAYKTLRPDVAALVLMHDVNEFVRDQRAATLGIRVIATVTKQDLVAERDGLCAEQASRTVSACIIAHSDLGYCGGKCGLREWRGGAVFDSGSVDSFGGGGRPR
jgi:hypothetical protein